MLIKNFFLIFIFGFLITACAWSIFSNVPSWYKQDFDESTTFYARGFGQSRQENFAVKKAVTEATSALAVKCQAYFSDFSKQMMQKNGIDSKSNAAEDYKRALLRAEKKIQQISEMVKEETQQSGGLYKVYKLIKVEKNDLEKLYLLELFD
jgi:hypothetical protein